MAAVCNLLTRSHPWVDADEGIYLVIGRDLGSERLPYRDFWDNHMPGIYAETWVLTRLGLPLGALRLVAGLAWLACLYPVARAWRFPTGGAGLAMAALPAAVILHPALNGESLYTEYGEGCALLLALAALVAAERAAGVWPGAGWCVLAGFLSAVAISFRPTAALYGPPLLWLAVWAARAARPRALPAAAFVLGAAGGLGLLILALASAGLLGDCLQLVGGANARITGTIDLAHNLRGWGVLVAGVLGMGFVVVLARRGAPWLREHHPRAATAATWLVVTAFVEALLPRKGWPHYLLPAFCFMLPFGWAALAGADPGRPPRRPGLLVGLLVLALCYSLGWAGVVVARWASPGPREVYGVSLPRLRGYLRPGDTVWSGGTRGADLYWYTGHPSATRYVYASSGAEQSGIRGDVLLGDLRASRPRLVLIGPQWLDADGELAAEAPAGLRAYLAGAYVREAGRPGAGQSAAQGDEAQPPGLRDLGPSRRAAAVFVRRDAAARPR